MSDPTPTQEQARRNIVADAISGSKNRRGRAAILAIIIIGTAFAIAAAIAGVTAYTIVQDSAKRGVTLAQQVQEACADPNVDDAELGTLCTNADNVVKDAPAAAQGPKGDTGSTGEPGQDGTDGRDGTSGSDGAPGPPPSPRQVANAVALYCGSGRCNGADGQDGTDGRNVTASQVASAVALYCDAKGQCAGPKGAAGAAGQNGTNGDRGPQGPPPSDTQVLGAVTTYCAANNNCQGPRGTEGQPGPQGEVGAQGPQGTPGTPGSVLSDGACDYDGVGTITVTLNTSTGPITFSCVGNPAPPN